MDWINKGDFQLKNNGGRHYVYRRMPNSSKRMINIPRNIRTKIQAKKWLRTHYKSPVKPLIVLNASRLAARRPPPPTRRLAAVPKMPHNMFGFKYVAPYGSPNNKNVPFNCGIRKHLYHRETENGKTGHKYMVANNWSNRLDLRTVSNTTVKKNLGKLDIGAQGAIFIASTKRRVPPSSEFAIKICPYDPAFKGKRQILDLEWEIQNKLYQVVPRHIPKLLAPIVRCQNFLEENLVKTQNFKPNYDYTKQAIMFSEYIRSGSLLTWFMAMAKSPRKRVTDAILKSFIFQVLNTVKNIRVKYPKFKHNDLHFGNILVKYGYPYPIMVLADFGWSKLNDEIANPLIAGGTFANSWGIGPKTSSKYDHHYFLNEFRRGLLAFRSASKDGWRETFSFLDRVLPRGYREINDTYTRESRLKYDIEYPGLPSLEQVLNDPYLSGATTPKNKSSPWKPKPANAKPANAKPANAKPVEPKAAAPPPRVFSNAELMALSAGGFTRLTPTTKARALALRKKNESKKPNLLKFNITHKKPLPAANSPENKKKVVIPRNVIKDPRFNRLAVMLMSPSKNGENSAEGYARWNRAVAKARKQIENRLANGRPAFSPVANAPRNSSGNRPAIPKQNLKLPKRPKPVKNVKRMGPSAPPVAIREPIKQPKPKKPLVVTNKANGKNKKAIKSPGGRVKVLSNSGRYVYAESKTVDELKKIAASMKVSVNGLKTKKNIALALFSAA